MAGPGAPKTGGRQSGTPNKITADVKAMVLAALDRAGGAEYLLAQAHDNPRAFLALLGRIIPLQVTGADGAALIPDRATDADAVVQSVLLMVKSLRAAKQGGAE